MKTPTLLLCAVCSGVLFGCHARKEAGEAPAPTVREGRIVFPANAPQLAYLATEPAESRKEAMLHFNGRLVWDDDETVRVFSPFGGRVSKLVTEVGQGVSPGDPLAIIESPDFGQAQADARQAGSAWVLAERTLNRVRDLFEHGAAPKKDLDSAEADFARAQAERQRAFARLAIYGGNTNLIDQLFQLKSPLRGVVVERNVNPGQEVRPDQMLANAPQLFAPLFVVTDPAHLWVWVDVSEHDLRLLRTGQSLSVRSRAYPERAFEGRLEVITDTLDPVTRTVKVRGSVDNRSRLLKAEMYVTVDVREAGQPGIEVPSKAVFFKGEKHFLFLEEQPGEFTRREIRIGVEHDGRIEVPNGVALGQRVVTDGCLLLEELLESAEGS
ncbi:MAG: efflux RND transporter periplasmic adaptor subunit [Limisphaerales bacterium]